MKKTLLIIALIIFNFLNIHSQTPFLIEQEVLNNGSRLILSNSYKEADIFWSRIIKQNPELPDGYFFKLMAMHIKMIDYENYTEAEKFNTYCDTVIAAAEKYSDKVKNEYYKYFYTGVVHFYQAFIYSKMENNISAFLSARAGASELKKCIEIDSAVCEPYPLLGAYKYWKSKKAGFLRKIKFIKDERELGIKFIKKGMKKSSTLSIFAGDQLAWIYIDKGEPNNALELARNNLDFFSGARSLKWTYAHSLLALQSKKIALKKFIDLHLEYKKILPAAEYNYLYTLKKIATLYLEENLEVTNKKQVLGLFKDYKKWQRVNKSNKNNEKIREKLNEKIYQIKEND